MADYKKDPNILSWRATRAGHVRRRGYRTAHRW